MRLKFKKSKQKETILTFKIKNEYTWKQFADYLNVKPGTLLSWYYERNLLPSQIYCKIDKKKNYRKWIVNTYNENWGQQKAGYGSKGSLKNIKVPKKCIQLAELVGIILGDGNIHSYSKGNKIGTYMLRIAGDKRLDKEYLIKYVGKMVNNLFGLKPKYDYRKSNEMLLICHSKNLVQFLIDIGLPSGHKIQNQVGIPTWIFKKNCYLKACIRGLIDTDGCVYALKPNYPHYYQISFKNYNIKLLRDVQKAFKKIGYPISKISCNKQIYLSQQAYIRKFYKEIGFSNQKHIRRFDIAP